MNDFEELPFEEQQITTNNIIDDSLEDLPFEEVPTITDDNNIIMIDPRIINITPKNAKISFKKPTIIFPVIAFIFVSILGMYIFVNNSKADTNDLIKIEENGKYGYIDTEGTVITRAKYVYGTDYYKGHAVVKNENNLYGVLNSKGVLEIPFGNYYYIGLFGNRYIASKVTKDGLKQAMLDSNLEELTSFKYDTVSYAKSGVYLFTRDETMGILNKEGKEIFTFKVDEVDDKNIDIEISPVTEDTGLENRYAKIKVNDSSAIINLKTGKIAYNYTLDDIEVLKNNVFYIKSKDANENSTYIVVGDETIKLKTNKYQRVRVEDLNSNIAICVNDDTSLSFVNLSNKQTINENTTNDYYYGDGLILEKTYDFERNREVYNILSYKGKEGSFDTYKPVSNEFVNDMLNIRVNENKYNYINKEGKLANDSSYDLITDYNEKGYAIVANDNTYGVINRKGKEVVKLSYENIEYLDDDIYKLLSESYKKDLFLFTDKNSNYGIVNSKNKVEIDSIYDRVDYITDKYPIILVTYEGDDLLLNLATSKELPIKISSGDIVVKSNYILVGDAYYNYSGKLIYSN